MLYQNEVGRSMNVVFMGTPEFAVPTLEALLRHDYAVLAVVTQPDRRKGRGQQMTPPPVKIAAQRRGIPTLQPEKARGAAFAQQLRALAPDVIVVVAYGQILPVSILSIPRLGCINAHASLLPKYRGAAPINWAIMRGETVTGVTTMMMDKGMDSGDILLTQAVPIEPRDTAATLHDTLARIGAELLIETLRQAEAGTLTRAPQDHAAATHAPMLKKEDGLIHWAESADVIERKIRGLFPWPCAYTVFHERCVKVLQGEVEPLEQPASGSIAPGTVAQIDPARGPLIATGAGGLRILRIQPENKAPMVCSDFCRGYRLRVGERLG